MEIYHEILQTVQKLVAVHDPQHFMLRLGREAQAHVGRKVGPDGVGAGVGDAGDECPILVQLCKSDEASVVKGGQKDKRGGLGH